MKLWGLSRVAFYAVTFILRRIFGGQTGNYWGVHGTWAHGYIVCSDLYKLCKNWIVRPVAGRLQTHFFTSICSHIFSALSLHFNVFFALNSCHIHCVPYLYYMAHVDERRRIPSKRIMINEEEWSVEPRTWKMIAKEEKGERNSAMPHWYVRFNSNLFQRIWLYLSLDYDVWFMDFKFLKYKQLTKLINKHAKEWVLNIYFSFLLFQPFWDKLGD